MGISHDKTALSLKEIYSNITDKKGAMFFTKYFGKTDLSAPGRYSKDSLHTTCFVPKN